MYGSSGEETDPGPVKYLSYRPASARNMASSSRLNQKVEGEVHIRIIQAL